MMISFISFSRKKRICVLLLLSVCSLLFFSCGSFKKGVRKYRDGRYSQAERIFQRLSTHPTWGLGALTYRERIRLSKARTLRDWLQSNQTLVMVFDSLNEMPISTTKRKLDKHGVNVKSLDGMLSNVQLGAIQYVRSSGNISGLDTLLDHFSGWRYPDSLRLFSDEFVNFTICCSVDAGEQESVCTPSNPYGISYDNATRIIKRHSALVRGAYLDKYWDIKDGIWNVFSSMAPPYCEMEQFRNDHPGNSISTDCWYDEAREALCNSSLKSALNFHARYPSSALDADICWQIACHARSLDDFSALDTAETTRLRDVFQMLLLRYNLCAGSVADTASFFQDMETLSRTYYEHAVMFDLAQRSVQYYIYQQEPEMAIRLIDRIAPYYLDKEVCPTGAFEFQEGKQSWFRKYRQMLEHPVAKSDALIQPVAAWNTPTNDEFAAVSWGIGEEVYFARRDGDTRKTRILFSRLNGTDWSDPAYVRELSFADDAIPLSITEDGLWFLLYSGGKIYQSARRKVSMHWSKPEPLPIALPLIRWASLSADGLHLLVEGVADTRNPVRAIFYCNMDADGRPGKPQKLPAPINLPEGNNAQPYITRGGRLLSMTSTRPGGLGALDAYLISLPEPHDFFNPDTSVVHLDWRFNTGRNDYGITFVSDFTGRSFFHRSDFCGRNLDIWETPLILDSIKSPPALRFAGILLDENGSPIPGDKGSFVEFLTDYKLQATKTMVAHSGTYMYMAPSAAKAVRIFPEVPGYYSERDTTHFPVLLSEDQIIKDTFWLTSFEHIRANFKLQYGTFYNKTAEFDDKDRVYPELVRLAKIARRMGAELVLTGHTDNNGTEAENQLLSEQRAEAVRTFLTDICGFEENKISTRGFGATQPKCSNDTEDGRRCNRRIEIEFKMPELPGKK